MARDDVLFYTDEMRVPTTTDSSPIKSKSKRKKSSAMCEAEVRSA